MAFSKNAFSYTIFASTAIALATVGITRQSKNMSVSSMKNKRLLSVKKQMLEYPSLPFYCILLHFAIGKFKIY